MKSIGHIVLSVFFLLIGQSAIGQAVMPHQSAFPQLSYSFSNSAPSRDQLKVFSERAVQKLEDLEGYLTILANPDYDKVFREKAEALVRGSFHDGELVLEHPLSRSAISIGSFLNFFSSADEEMFFVPSFSEIDAGEIPYWHEDEYYAGELVFHFALKRVDPGAPSPDEKDLWYKIHYRIEQQVKQFGDREKAVWEVRLGSMTKN